MNHAEIIGNAEVFARDLLGDEPTGHDWWHLVRVRNIAKRIHAVEGGNWFVIDLALLLHDVGDRKVIDAPEDDYTIAETFLHEQAVDQIATDSIMYIIKNMSFSSALTSQSNSESIELQIVQDSDRLDALGAIGIARAFAYGGKNGRPLYNPDVQAGTFTDSESYKNIRTSTFHHFEEKIFLLKDLLNTDTAKQIAEARDQYMKDFTQQFLAEWDGER